MKRVSFFLSLLLLGLLIPVSISPLNGQIINPDTPVKPTIYVDPPRIVDPSLIPGSSFSVDVKIRDAVDVLSWHVDLGWDPTILEVISYNLGDFLSDDPYNEQISIPSNLEEGNEGGFFWLSTVDPDPLQTDDGDGLLCTITFRVKKIGETVLDLARPEAPITSKTVYVNSEPRKIEVRKENGYVSTIMKWAEEDWPTFHHDLNRSGLAPAEAADSNFILWTFTNGNPVSSSPAVVEGRLYFSITDETQGNATLFCLNASTGIQIWNSTVEGYLYSPTVVGDRVYLGGGIPGWYKMFCFDAMTGTLLWDYENWGLSPAAPAVAYGGVYFGDRNERIYCLDAENGSLRWQYETTFITGHVDKSAPAVVDGRLYVGCDDHQLYCLDAFTGSLHWTFMTGGGIESSPAVVAGRVYLGSDDANVYCLDAVTGTKLWNYTTGDMVTSSPAVSNDRVYVGSLDNRVYCLNATTGAHLWNVITDDDVYSSPAVAGSRVYVGSYDSRIYCLDAETGAVIWTYQTGFFVWSSPAIWDGCVYIGSLDSKLYAFGGGSSFLPVERSGVTYSVSAKSNSLVPDLSFEEASKTISVTTTGDPGTSAFVNITFPTPLLDGPYSLLEDGTSRSYEESSNSTHVAIYAEYVNDVHTFEVVGTSVIPDYPTVEVYPRALVFPQNYPIDYPSVVNETVITNIGNVPLIVESIDFTLNEGDAYAIDVIYLEGFGGALLPTLPPFELARDESAYVRIMWTPPDVELYMGTLEIISNDPSNTTIEIAMSGGGTTASGVTTAPYRIGQTEILGSWFILSIDKGENIIESSVVSTLNVPQFQINLTDDEMGAVIIGYLDHLALPGQLIVEITTDNVTAPLDVYEILIVPDLSAVNVYSINWGESSYEVVLQSNSTIAEFEFNQLQQSLTLNVTVPFNLDGFCNITIPDDLMSGDFSIYIDDVLLVENMDYTQTYNGTHYNFSLTYGNRTHIIEIFSTTVIPELTSIMILSTLVISTLVIIMYGKKPQKGTT